MATLFSRTMRAVDDRSSRGARLAVILAFALLWGGWMWRGKVTVYASSTQARLEVRGLPRRVSSQESGRISALHVDLGRSVTEGEVLVELDTSVEERQRDEARAKVASLEPKLAAIREQVDAARAVRAARWAFNAKTVDHAKVELAGAETVASRQAKLGAIADRLSDATLLSTTDKLKAEGDLSDSRQKIASTTADIARLESSQHYDDRQEASRIAELDAKLADLEAERGASLAQVEVASAQIERRRVRAPATGKLGKISPLQIGDVIKSSDVVAIVVPSDEIHVVAELAPSEAVGRVLPGQSARVRLDGFSWTQYGMLDARVVNVANEPTDGTVRVELLLADFPAGDAGRVPVQHGLPGAVDIEVDHVSPWTLLLRSAGSAMAPAPAPAVKETSPVAVAR